MVADTMIEMIKPTALPQNDLRAPIEFQINHWEDYFVYPEWYLSVDLEILKPDGSPVY